MSRADLALAGLLVAGCAASPTLQQVAYPDGTPHWEYALRDGVPDGVGRVWHRGGKLASEGTYAAGLKHGRFKFYGPDGAFDHVALFWRNVEVWRSTDPAANPPDDLPRALATLADRGVRPAVPVIEATSEGYFEPSRDPVPAPYFVSLDRATTLHRVGLQLSPSRMNAVTLFGSYPLGRFGAYGELTAPRLGSGADMNVGGRLTAELGGARVVDLGAVGAVALHAGALVPLGNDDQDGYVGSAAAARLRPADAAASFPSTGALRMGASLVRRQRYLVLQADAGLDAIVGGPDHTLAALGRANLGVGLGIRALMLSLESSNTVRLGDTARRLHAVATGVTIWFGGAWFTASFAYGTTGDQALNLVAGYEL